MYKTIVMNKIRYLLFWLLFISPSIPALAQNTTIECMYEYRYVSDTTATKMSESGVFEEGDSTKIVKENLLLYCGGSVSLFYSYDQMVVDSVSAANKLAGKPALAGYKSNMGSSQRIYKDFGNGKITLFDKIGMDWFKIVETLPAFEWNLCNEWKDINGYRVSKATCCFRGRSYEAWYAPDIPVSDGPWKFCGLPGLVFEVYDTPCHYHYRLTGIRTKEVPVDYPDLNAIETNMKKFNDTKRRYLENPALYMSNTYGGAVSFVDREGNAIDPETLKKELRYDFQETDFK